MPRATLIDRSRAFIEGKDLPNKIERFDEDFWNAIQRLFALGSPSQACRMRAKNQKWRDSRTVGECQEFCVRGDWRMTRRGSGQRCAKQHVFQSTGCRMMICASNGLVETLSSAACTPGVSTALWKLRQRTRRSGRGGGNDPVVPLPHMWTYVDQPNKKDVVTFTRRVRTDTAGRQRTDTRFHER